MSEETNIVNVQAKKLLARLLVTEAITVIHAGTRTASFDPKRRILTLPIWKTMSGDLYDLFVLHEVSHALYTPQGSKPLIDACNRVASKYPKAAKRFVNIVEDARIERLIKVTYPGGRGAFIRGYTELVERDFFGTKGRDINDFGIIDRINIYFKTGNNDIQFTDYEMQFIHDIEKVLTFDEVIGICERLYTYAKEERDKKKAESEEDCQETENDDPESGNEELDPNSKTSKSSMNDSEDDDDSDVDVDPDTDDDEDIPDENDESIPDENEETSGDADNGEETNSDEKTDEDKKPEKAFKDSEAEAPKINDDPIESVTDKTWEEKQEELCDLYARPIRYLGIPKPILENIIVPYKKVHSNIRKHYLNAGVGFVTSHSEEFARFKDENKTVVDWLIKEFEMRKAANQYSRSLSAKTGILDMNKLNQYRFADDIMKKVTSIIGGKNHALEIFVDWSGSMVQHALGTIHQLINIAMFCRKEQIPFNAYTFGAETVHSQELRGKTGQCGNADVFQFEIEDFGFFYGFSLHQVLSSTMSAMEFNDACINLFMMASSCGSGQRGLPKAEKMSGTPLNEAIVSAIEIVNRLRKKTNIQVINTVFITDGEATTDGRYIHEVKTLFETTYIDYGKEDVFLRDSVTHIDYPLSNIKRDTTKAFLQIFRNRTKTNVIGFFISGGDKYSQKIDIATLYPERWGKGEFEQNKIEKELEENNFVLVPNMGYTEFYIIPGGRELRISLPGSPLTGIMGNGKMVTAMSAHGLKQRKQRICLNRFIKIIS